MSNLSRLMATGAAVALAKPKSSPTASDSRCLRHLMDAVLRDALFEKCRGGDAIRVDAAGLPAGHRFDYLFDRNNALADSVACISRAGQRLDAKARKRSCAGLKAPFPTFLIATRKKKFRWKKKKFRWKKTIYRGRNQVERFELAALRIWATIN